MSEENQPGEENLRQEFEALGKNLIEALHSAWGSPESRRLREEISAGLGDLSGTLKREAEELASSPAANKVRTSVEDVGEKLRSPEIHSKVRGELIGALKSVNSELQKVIDRWSAEPVESAAANVPAVDFPQPAPGETDVAGSGNKPNEQS